MSDVEKKFCELIKEGRFEDAAELVEEYAILLVKMEVATSPIQKISELTEKLITCTSKVDRALIKSEVLKLRLGCLSEAIAEVLMRLDEEGCRNLSKLMEALNNFYRYYSGTKE